MDNACEYLEVMDSTDEGVPLAVFCLLGEECSCDNCKRRIEIKAYIDKEIEAFESTLENPF